MNIRFNQNWRWAIFQLVVVLILLPGCGGSGNGDEDDTSGSSEASLSGLTLDGIALDHTFQSDQLNYSASVGFSQDRVTLFPVASDNEASILVNGVEVASDSASAVVTLTVGQNLIEILVTSDDGLASQTYTLSVMRASASSEANLSDLSLNDATLDQLFQPNQTTYTASVGFLQTSVTLAPVASDADASIHVNGTEVSSGASSTITLSEGQNRINLEVTAEDEVTTHSYSIDIMREEASIFAQQAYLKASDAEGGYSQWHGYYGDQFGSSVAISGDTLVVGAPGRSIRLIGIEWDDSKINYGVVYVFTRNDGIWSQQARLEASNAETNDYFGVSVAISGDTLVVGAIGEDSSISGGEDNNSIFDAGAVYVFTRSGSVWTQQALLKASYLLGSSGRGSTGNEFGYSVAISGDTLIVGSPNADSSDDIGDFNELFPARSSGAAFVFTRTDGVWNQLTSLSASNAEEGDGFGASVAISNDTVVVGAPHEDGNASGGENDNSASGVGAAYVFKRIGGVWNQQAYLKSSTARNGHVNVFGSGFGARVAISGDTIAVSYPSGNSLKGEVFVFNRSGEVWEQQVHLKSSTDVFSYFGDAFGTSLALSGDTLVVGESTTGQVTVFTRSGGIWSQQTVIKGRNTEIGDQFSCILAISGDTLVVGAPYEDSSATGGEADNSASNAGAVYTWQ
ncbi:MAG: cadherin-like beta sandwich domain-containing protein [Candidatus Thiodiazotropha endolucinida]